jgi:hypothetical protein
MGFGNCWLIWLVEEEAVLVEAQARLRLKVAMVD